MNTRQSFYPLTILIAIGFLSVSTEANAQPPRAPDWVELQKPYIAYNDSLIRGEIVDADYLDAIPLGDIDNSGTDDFALHARVVHIDTAGEGEAREQLMIYKDVESTGLADAEPQIITLTEWKTDIRFLATGDWDSDGYRDLCIDMRFADDTSNGNSSLSSEIHRIIVFWNDGQGGFSLNDTTRLLDPGGLANGVWIGGAGLTYDYSGDGVDDLILRTGSAYVDGSRIPTPRVNLFYGGRGTRWGRSGVPATPVWSWWNLPEHDRVRIVDQNCDNLPDIVFFNDSPWVTEPDLTILYGSHAAMQRGVPDTIDADTLRFNDVSGRSAYAELEDYTSDGVLDLILTGEDNYWRVYVGEPGWRITEVYGSGNDTADPEEGYPNNRPWTLIPMPGRLSPGWGSPTNGPIKLLGDVNNDGWRDLWSISSFYVIVYSAGPGFDAWIDGYVPYGGEFDNLVTLGDVDGTGVTMNALVNHRIEVSGIQFFKSSDLVPWEGTPKPVPANHNPWTPTPNRCNSKVSVEEDDRLPDSLDLSLKTDD